MGFRVIAEAAMQAQLSHTDKRIVRVFCDGDAQETINLIYSEPPVVRGAPGIQWSDGTITQF